MNGKSVLVLVFFLFSLYAKEIELNKDRVLLIHGIINHSSMTSLNRRFKQDGWEVINWKYPSTKRTIEEHGKELSNYLKELSKESDTPIHYVAFSLGGLVLRSALSDKDLPIAAKEGKIILISSPINGSKFARSIDSLPLIKKILGKHAGKQLLETSEEEFARQLFPENMPILVLSGTFGLNPMFKEKNDGKVSVSESCPYTPHVHRYILAGHSWICRNPMIFDECIRFIKDPSNHNLCKLHPIK